MTNSNNPIKPEPNRDEKGRFGAGNNANPNGRPPRAWTMSTLIEEALEEVETQSGKSFKSLVAKRLAHMAVNGDIQAIKEINDRIDGKPRQSTDITSGGRPIPIMAVNTHVSSNDSDTENSES
jgi:hypothetical protein